MTSRRNLLKGAGSVLAAGALSATRAHAAEADRCGQAANPATFVLVHGAWCGGWVWDGVASKLRAVGHVVHTPTLTGLAERRHLLTPEVSLDTHIADIANPIGWNGWRGIVLAGHSYGGLVISGAAQALPAGSIGSIVYLDALMAPFPPDGQSPVPDLPVEDGLVPPPGAETFGYDGEVAEYLNAHTTPMPLAAFSTPIGPCPMVEDIPLKTYIRATHGMDLMQAFYERCKADPSWKTAAIDAHHTLMVDEPEQTAAFLGDAI